MTPTRPNDAHRLRRFLLAFIAALALIVSGLTPTVAFAAESSLRIDKRVDDLDLQDQLVPGEEFTYTIDIFCDDVDCENVTLTDQLPAELAGFEFVEWTYTPQTLDLTATATGCEEEGGVPVAVTEDCTIDVAFQQDLGDGAVGLLAGGTLKLSVVLRVPQNLPADWEFNGDTITNTATAAWDNGEGDAPDEVSDGADVQITIERDVDVTASKTWEPASQQFSPGDLSTITIGAQNQSNIGADALVIQEPSGAP